MLCFSDGRTSNINKTDLKPSTTRGMIKLSSSQTTTTHSFCPPLNCRCWKPNFSACRLVVPAPMLSPSAHFCRTAQSHGKSLSIFCRYDCGALLGFRENIKNLSEASASLNSSELESCNKIATSILYYKINSCQSSYRTRTRT